MTPPIDARLILTFATLVFAGLASWQWLRVGKLLPSGRIWLRVAVIFAAVSVWMWWRSALPRA